ncbi:premnaspirodiene oxygenase-like [Nicotiana tomentosiformis]|uniref:premnaspirodiene oxygenase-like n=1 Tax=Nicotiana tomentosiformis TaxID=4098 RepID=UPI00051AE280|nr:premnaspirodiene oxygenase-like [Nicotiana tomentosiformis]
MESVFLEEFSLLKLIKISIFPFIILFLQLWSLKKKSKLPPGPAKLPFIGNLNQLMTPTPHKKLRDLALKYGPLMYLKLGMVPTIVVSSADAAEKILKTNDLAFAGRPKLVAPKILGYNYTDIAFAPYGTYWRQLRKICILELLSSKRVNSFASARREELNLFLQSIASSCGGKPINLAEMLFALNHDITTRITFGSKADDQMRFRAATKEGTVLVSGFQIGDFFPSLSFVALVTGMTSRIQKIFVETDSIISKIIDEHTERNKRIKPEHEDLLDVLLRIMENEELEVPLTIDNIKSILLEMIVAGSENASNSVEWAMTEMIKNPKVLTKAQKEVRNVVKGKPTIEENDLHKLSYIKMVIKETLRFHPPVPLLLPKESLENCTIDDYEIPANTRVFINYWAISRDPKSWENPENFEPERFENVAVDFKGHDFEFIPFGAGRRICPGISFGMLNLELSLAAMLYHFDWKLPQEMKPEDVDMNETFGMTLFKTSSLHLVPTLHFPVPS